MVHFVFQDSPMNKKFRIYAKYKYILNTFNITFEIKVK